MRVNNDQLSALIGIAIGAFVVWHASTYKIGSFSSPQLGFFPLAAGLGILSFSLFGLVAASWQAIKGQQWKPLLKESAWWRPLIVVLLLLAYAATVEFLGFPIATWLLLLSLFLALEQMPLRHALAASLLITGAAHVLFAMLLQVQLPKGILGL